MKGDFDVLSSTIQKFNYTTEIDRLHAEINVLNGDIGTLRDDIRALQDAVIELDIHDASLEAAIQTITDDLEDLETKFDDLAAKTTQLEAQSDSHEIRLNNLDGVVSGLRADLNHLKDQVDQLNHTDQARVIKWAQNPIVLFAKLRSPFQDQIVFEFAKTTISQIAKIANRHLCFLLKLRIFIFRFFI